MYARAYCNDDGKLPLFKVVAIGIFSRKWTRRARRLPFRIGNAPEDSDVRYPREISDIKTNIRTVKSAR